MTKKHTITHYFISKKQYDELIGEFHNKATRIGEFHTKESGPQGIIISPRKTSVRTVVDPNEAFTSSKP